MPVICEKVAQSELVKKASYEGVQDFILVRKDTTTVNTKITSKWRLESCFLPKYYENLADKIENFQIRPDDVWLIGFPKSGTTWMQELIWLICNNLDYEGAKVEVRKRFPILEIGSLLSRTWKYPDELPRIQTSPSPRFIKSHLPCHLLPTQLWTIRPKIVYIVRNIKDITISYYHHYVNIQHYSGSFQDFVDVMLDNKTLYSPYHTHVLNFYNMRNEENILFLTYESMKINLKFVIQTVTDFFDKRYTQEQIIRLTDHLSFRSCAKNPSINYINALKNREVVVKRKMKDPNFNFVRRGESGSYLDEMNPENVKKFDAWTEWEMEKLECDPELRKVFYYNQNFKK